jgi:hypothetical protein
MRSWMIGVVGFVAVTAMAGQVAAGGVECMLSTVGLTHGWAAAAPGGGTIALKEGAFRIGPETVVIRVERMEPKVVPAGQFVVAPKPGDGDVSAWMLVAGSEPEIAALAKAIGFQGAKARRVGGIETCSLYTPCAKCRGVFEAEVARRKTHPAMFRVTRAGAAAIRPGQCLVAPASARQTTSPWLLLFRDEREIMAVADTAGFHRAGDASTVAAAAAGR